MERKEIMALLLAGGQGSRLGILTKNTAKPAVRFGGKYRIIDFPLSTVSTRALIRSAFLHSISRLCLTSISG